MFGKDIKETKVKSVKSSIDYSVPQVNKCNLGKQFGYRNKRGKLSLPCPCGGFLFGDFPEIFDNYDDDIKLSLLPEVKKEVIQLKRYLSRGMIGYIQKVENI